MKTSEREASKTSKPVKLVTKLALFAGALLMMLWATVLTVQGRYVDVEQGLELPAEGPSLAAHDMQANR